MRRSITEIPRLIFKSESRMLSDTKVSREPSALAPRSSAAKNAVGSMIASTLTIRVRLVHNSTRVCTERTDVHPVINSDGLREAWCG